MAQKISESEQTKLNEKMRVADSWGIKMNNIVYRKSCYRLFISKWGIAIILEAGYQELYDDSDKSNYIKLCENLYFFSSCLPYPNSVCINAEELEYFCKGLKLVSAQIVGAMQYKPCLIQLKSVLFSDCNIQNDAFTASAIQWASEAFMFPMPAINVWFDDTAHPCGEYKFDFTGNKLPV